MPRAKTRARPEKPSAIPPDHRPPLTLPEAAVYLNVPHRFIRRLVEERRIRSLFYANKRFIEPADLDAFKAEAEGKARDDGR